MQVFGGNDARLSFGAYYLTIWLANSPTHDEVSIVATITPKYDVVQTHNSCYPGRETVSCKSYDLQSIRGTSTNAPNAADINGYMALAFGELQKLRTTFPTQVYSAGLEHMHTPTNDR